MFEHFCKKMLFLRNCTKIAVGICWFSQMELWEAVVSPYPRLNTGFYFRHFQKRWAAPPRQASVIHDQKSTLKPVAYRLQPHRAIPVPRARRRKRIPSARWEVLLLRASFPIRKTPRKQSTVIPLMAHVWIVSAVYSGQLKSVQLSKTPLAADAETWL